MTFAKVLGMNFLSAMIALSTVTTSAWAKDTTQEKIAAAPASAWAIQPKIRLEPVTVKLGQDVYKPTYFVRLGNGKVIELPPASPSIVSGLSKADAAAVAEDTRVILESVLRLMRTAPSASAAIITGDYAVVGKVDGTWLKTSGLKIFDPVAELVASPETLKAAEILGAEALMGKDRVSEAESALVVQRDAKTLADSLTDREMGRPTRLQKFLMFMKEAVYTSTVAAFKNHILNKNSMKQRITESGIQFAFRGEIQIGMGSFNFIRNFPFMLSFGYNRETRSIIFRRGTRTEKMSGGTAMLLGGRIEIRRYRMNSDEASSGDARKDYAKIKGTSWYPPSVPILSPVADSGPGYQSEGLGFGFNLPSLFAPSTLVVDAAFAIMNTVNSFEETQRVYAIEVPEPTEWMKRIHRHMDNSAQTFGAQSFGGGRGARCSHLFESTLISAR